MPFSPKPLTEDDIKAITEFEGGILRGSKQFGISKERFKKIKEAGSFEEAIALAQPKEKNNQDDGHKGEVRLSEVKVKGAPIRFKIKDEEISLSADDLFECYFIYLDMKKRLGLTESFSEVLSTGMKTTWSLTQNPVVTEGGEVKDANFE
jgi:hypothetical protein